MTVNTQESLAALREQLPDFAGLTVPVFYGGQISPTAHREAETAKAHRG